MIPLQDSLTTCFILYQLVLHNYAAESVSQEVNLVNET